MARLSELTERYDNSRDKRDVGQFLYFKMFEPSDLLEAARIAQDRGASMSVVEQLKTASPATGSDSLNTPVGVALERLISANAPRSVFETMRPDMTEVPLRTRLIYSTAAITASEVAEGAAKPLRRLNLGNLDAETAKFVGHVALSLEFMVQAPQLAQRLIVSALPESVNVALDNYFLGKIAGEEVGESSGEANPTWAQMLADLEELMRLVHVGSSSKLYLVMQPRISQGVESRGIRKRDLNSHVCRRLDFRHSDRHLRRAK